MTGRPGYCTCTTAGLSAHCPRHAVMERAPMSTLTYFVVLHEETQRAARLELPAELRPAEAEKIAAFVRRLAALRGKA